MGVAGEQCGDVLFMEPGGLRDLLRGLAGESALLSPTRTEHGFDLIRVEPGEAAVDPPWNGARTIPPLKGLWFRPAAVVARSTPETSGAGLDPAPIAVYGARACDLQGLAILDRVLRDHVFREPVYCASRERNLIISGDCTEPAESCFCTLLGGLPHPTAGFDLNLAPVSGGYVVEVGSARGRALVGQHTGRFAPASSEQVEERDRARQQVEERVRRQNERFATREPFERAIEKNLKTRIWGEVAATCVECGACNLACPTCHCFQLQDAAPSGAPLRFSLWDSCISAGHARMAGGGTPRLQLTERFKNHYYHKFVSFPRNWGVTACTGCGRCIDVCPGRIDKRSVLLQLETRWIPSEVAEVE